MFTPPNYGQGTVTLGIMDSQRQRYVVTTFGVSLLVISLRKRGEKTDYVFLVAPGGARGDEPCASDAVPAGLAPSDAAVVADERRHLVWGTGRGGTGLAHTHVGARGGIALEDLGCPSDRWRQRLESH